MIFAALFDVSACYSFKMWFCTRYDTSTGFVCKIQLQCYLNIIYVLF